MFNAMVYVCIKRNPKERVLRRVRVQPGSFFLRVPEGKQLNKGEDVLQRWVALGHWQHTAGTPWDLCLQ